MEVQYVLTADGQRLLPVVAVMKEFGLWLKGRIEMTIYAVMIFCRSLRRLSAMLDQLAALPQILVARLHPRCCRLLRK